MESYFAERGFALRRAFSLFDALEEVGLGQADLVLCLLRLDTARARAAVERVIGRPIVRCPEQDVFRKWRAAGKIYRRGDDRLVLSVTERPRTLSGNPVLMSGGLQSRFGHIRVGRSLRQLLSRGLTRRDLRTAERRGVMTVEMDR